MTTLIELSQPYEHLELFFEGFNEKDYLQWGFDSTNSKEQLILAAKEKLKIANIYFKELGTREGGFITIDYSVGGYSYDEYIALKFKHNGDLIEFTIEG